jgi:hypothetical protein
LSTFLLLQPYSAAGYSWRASNPIVIANCVASMSKPMQFCGDSAFGLPAPGIDRSSRTFGVGVNSDMVAAGERLEALYVLTLTMGLRQGELMTFKWRDVDLDGATSQVCWLLSQG